MNKLTSIAILAIALTLMACPYEGPVELNNYAQSTKLDKKLLSQWVAFHGDGGREELMLEKGDKTVIKVNHRQYNAKNKITDRQKYRAYGTSIKGVALLNIEATNGNYLYGKYSWAGKNEFKVQFIDADFMEENLKLDSVTTKTLRAFIGDNINKEGMFGEELLFYKKGSPEYEKILIYRKKSGF